WALSDMGDRKKQSLKEALQLVTSEDSSPQFLMKSVVYLLGSPHYQKSVNQLQSVQPDFVEPYLPTPEEKAEKMGGQSSEPENAIILADASSSMLLQTKGKQKMK